MAEDEEYELIPLNPLRKMERRLEKLEKTSTSQEMLRELVDIVKTNQQIVDDIVKINSDIINKITDLTAAVNGMMNKIDDFMSRIEVTTEEEESKEGKPPASNVEERLEKLEKRINSLILSTVARSRMRAAPVRRPAPTTTI